MGRSFACPRLAGLAIAGALILITPAQAQTRADAVALQQILADKGCYRARVDGIWGPASRGALALILERQSGQTLAADALQPTPENRSAVETSGLRCQVRTAAPTPRDPATPSQGPRTPRVGQPRTVGIGGDCPGPGCPLSPGEVLNETWDSIFR
ncbi:peptidoglycan-binding protein [Yoonia sp. R2331]|uniref:peptidoglycan-binding domain-containing protein n=1 Tax=Yoonia sp. R2331 TaxID=3237238 RepID=UPI0034E3B09E